MSSCTVESLLFKLCNDRELKASFCASPEAVMDGFPLSPQERAAFLAWDVRSLADAGASPMLLMFGFTAVHGMEQGRPEYIRRMKGPSTTNEQTERKDYSNG